MFICDDCLVKHYYNPSSLAHSYGTCEICGHVHICNDIQSGALNPRRANAETQQPANESGEEPQQQK